MTRQLFFRKAHRYLGIFIGIQFLMWTLSGLYFSWTNIDSIHGDQLLKPAHYIAATDSLVSPAVAIQNLKASQSVDSLYTVNLVDVLHKPVYQVAYFSGHAGEGHHLHVHHAMFDARTGAPMPALTRDQAVAVARHHVRADDVESVTYLEQTSAHHEYRERPLPAWAVTFRQPQCTAYISAALGTFQTVRHDSWRAFDFLWMMHTMDYESRDNINTWMLRAFSAFGLITVLSGFVLYFMSSGTWRKLARSVAAR